jgi:prepilin-type N-terminal cleavage/methylation domain-containing protein
MDQPVSAFSKGSEGGFSLIEVMISLLIFAIAATGVTYSLVESNRQMIIAEHIFNGQQQGMAESVTGSPNPALNQTVQGTASQKLNMPVAITLSPAQASQYCSPGLINGLGQILDDLLRPIICLLPGSCTAPTHASPAITSYTVSVPVTAITTSQSQIAWWLP